MLLFSSVFGIIWMWMLWNVSRSMTETKKICVLAAALCGGAVLAAFLIKKFFPRFWNHEKAWTALMWTVLAATAAGLVYAGMELRVYPGWDFGAVYQGASELAQDGKFSDGSNWYFTTYPNNVAACLFLAGFFKLFGWCCSYITLGVLLNAGLITLGLAFFALLAKRMYGVRTAVLGMLLCMAFLPFYMHAPIFYTDTFALPFVTGSFLLYQMRKKDSRFLLATAVLLAAGYKIKGSLGVIMIALLIHIWLQKGKLAEHVKESVFLLVPWLLLIGFLTFLPGQMRFMDTSDAEKNEFPLEHWIAMGLEGNGGYNADVYWMTASAEGREAKKLADREFIRKKWEEYGADGLAVHLKDKVRFTWGDGVYFAPEKLKRDPMKESRLHSWVLYDGADYPKTYRFCSAVHLLLLTGILTSLIKNIWKKGEVREAGAMQLAVFGLFLFLLIWETRSRYLINFVPIFILLGLDGIAGFTGRESGEKEETDRLLQGQR